MACAASCSPSRGSVLAVVAVLAVAAVASPPRSLGASAEMGGPNWHMVSISSLLPSSVCTPAKAASTNSSSVLSVVHRHGPCSPLPSHRDLPSPAEILERDQQRVNAIRRKITGASSAITTSHASNKDKGVSVPARLGWSFGSNNYIMPAGLGTPARQLYVEIDSGSDLSWVQCKPCKDCYPQQDPLFDPANSSTYSSVHCGAKACKDLTSSHNCSSDDTCRYEYLYADQSHTGGHLARDTLTLGPSSDDNKVLGFVFGCGDDDKGTFAETDGLFGLGRAKVSLASQAAARYGAPGFSYCLPSTSSATGYLSLGVTSAPANARFTAMATRSDEPSFYYVDLVGFKVAGRKVEVPASAFKTTTGTIVDSGTVFSRLPPRAYAALRAAFTRAMARYNYTRAPALTYLDTCYDFAGRTEHARIPAVALVFADGTELNLGPRGVLYVASVAQMCLAFAAIEDDFVGILGNAQQKTFAVVYDVANKRIGFGANGCG
ncbi:hypothetical protein PR202_ga15478 [Eleusine coracana subsp. coracana]|uniref:Peptidase A1 domain-containing protein n=1 Tax=Eleusine coracana subsp. coracana TaxID=191504 RepID=A0AAV5CJI0_ELECO|nr:hypothetical protein QOZ80_6BG0492560 [Eleusine coracana subsp. coracana]GJM98463.1 hypothetical protein PR202_ga15478 [Eleusine coracana subsp. coracana]